MDQTAPAELLPAAGGARRAGLAAWLGMLLVGLLCLNTAGGWVRLSGSGVAIPRWPVIELDGGRKTLLPPFTDAGWAAAHAAWQAHQTVLLAKVAAGEIHPQALGRQPSDLAAFRSMFLTEWFHRLLAALVGLLAFACLGTALTDAGLRRRIGVPITAAMLLILAQAVLGAALIGQGTSTRWLFLHQGNAAAILALVLVAVLRLVDGGPPAMVRRDRAVTWATAGAMALAWCGLVVGGLLAASRHHLPPGGLLGLDAGPAWWPAYSIADNLLDNAALHHLLHRGVAVLLSAALVAALALAHRRGAPERARLALAVAATFAALQAVIGVGAAVLPGSEIAVPLAHLFLGHVLFLVLVLAWHDVRHGEADARAAERMVPG